MDDREKLIEFLGQDVCPILCPARECAYFERENCCDEKLADSLIANNVVVREKGEWQIRIADYGDVYIMCSACGSEFYVGDSDDIFNKKPNFCMECGADMRGDKNEID